MYYTNTLVAAIKQLLINITGVPRSRLIQKLWKTDRQLDKQKTAEERPLCGSLLIQVTKK